MKENHNYVYRGSCNLHLKDVDSQKGKLWL